MVSVMPSAFSAHSRSYDRNRSREERNSKYGVFEGRLRRELRWCDGVCVMGAAEAGAGQTLQNHVPKAVGESRRLGPLSGMSRLNLAIGLPLRNRPELDLFLEQISDPRSPNYRRYLSASEFAERFGPTQGHYDKLIEFFQANGFGGGGGAADPPSLDVSLARA